LNSCSLQLNAAVFVAIHFPAGSVSFLPEILNRTQTLSAGRPLCQPICDCLTSAVVGSTKVTLEASQPQGPQPQLPHYLHPSGERQKADAGRDLDYGVAGLTGAVCIQQQRGDRLG
jgi:hypothetical protein